MQIAPRWMCLRGVLTPRPSIQPGILILLAKGLEEHERGEGQVEERLQLPHVLLEARLALLHAFEEKRGEEAHRDSQHLRDALARHGILEEGERAHREHHATKGAGRELANGALGVGGVFERAHARVGKAVGIRVEAEAEHAVVERTRRVEGLRVERDACGANRCGATVNEWWRGKRTGVR